MNKNAHTCIFIFAKTIDYLGTIRYQFSNDLSCHEQKTLGLGQDLF